MSVLDTATREYQLRERFSTVDLLIVVPCFFLIVNNIFNGKRRYFKLVSTMRLTVYIHPFCKTSLLPL